MQAINVLETSWTPANTIHNMYSLISLLISSASFIATVASAVIARNSLRQTKRIADRDSADWIQRRWFDLYFEADRAYDALDRFQALYADGIPSPQRMEWQAYVAERNDPMLKLRKVYSMSLVFPINQTIDKLHDSSKGFDDTAQLLSKERLEAMLEVVQELQSKARIKDISILQELS
jgi:hypothetical protein